MSRSCVYQATLVEMPTDLYHRRGKYGESGQNAGVIRGREYDGSDDGSNEDYDPTKHG